MTILTDRKDIAQALNFGKYPVLSFNLDSDKGCSAVVLENTRNHGILRKGCSLYRGKITKDDGIFYLLTNPTIMSANISVNDYLKRVELANAPVINEGDVVAILIHSKLLNSVQVELVKAGKVTADYATAVTFEALK